MRRFLPPLSSLAMITALACGPETPAPSVATAPPPPLTMPAEIAAPPPGPSPAQSPLAAPPAPGGLGAEPGAKRPPPPPLVHPKLIAGRHAPSALSHPARPTHIPDGIYACKTDTLYKLRTCSVERDAEGRTWLETLDGNLLPMRGVLEEEKGELVFEGFPTEPAPFGCYTCEQGCTEAQELGLRTCLEQPLRIRLRGGGTRWSGALSHDTYFQSFDFTDGVRTPKAFDIHVNKYVFTLARKLKPGEPASPGDAPQLPSDHRQQKR